MPIYEYGCTHCSDKAGKPFRFEIKQGFEARTDIRCPNCDGLANRKMSRFSFSLDGTVGKPSQTMPGARRVEI